MRKAIATVSLSGTLDAKLTAAAAARFDGIELFDNDLVASDLSPEDVARRCADLGLSIELFQPIRDVEGWPAERFDAVLRRVRRKFDIMARLGVDACLACSSVSPHAVDDLDLTAEQLAAVGDVAAEYGIRVAFEALAWGRHIDRVGRAWEAVRRADHPHVGLAVDTFHMLSRGDGPEAIADVPGDAVAYLQIADAPRLEMDVLSWSRHHRSFPGQGDLDVAGLVSAVVAAGYRGPLSLEVFSDVVRTADPRLTALDAMRSLLHLEEEMRALREASPRPQRPAVDLFDPPPVPSRVDAGFVEFAVDPGDQVVPDLLTGLGFAHVGDHRHRAVQWWRNGDAHVCVTTLPVSAAGGTDRRRPFVSALAVVTDEVRDVATRAEALLWPSVRYRRGPFEAALPGIDTPDGVHVFLGSPAGEPDDWRRDYRPTPGRDDFDHGDWRGIDHVGLTVAADALPAEQAFYTTVFGLRAGSESEFIRPGGRLLSRPLRPARGDLRIVLAARDSHAADGASGTCRGIGQVAFHCPDVVAAVGRARARGVRFLPVPENYYLDLDARFDLEPGLLDMLRENGLMYDEDDDGRLLHAYTETVAGSFYVELVQRVGGYDGYGAPGTHVRLAVQERLAAR